MTMKIASTEAVTVAADGLTLSGLIWRRFQRDMPGLVELTLDMNPGLAALCPVLPPGLVVNIPIPTTETEPDRLGVVRLW